MEIESYDESQPSSLNFQLVLAPDSYALLKARYGVEDTREAIARLGREMQEIVTPFLEEALGGPGTSIGDFGDGDENGPCPCGECREEEPTPADG